MRQINAFLALSLALCLGSGCLIVIDDDSSWSGPPVATSCSYVCDDYGCWEVCYDTVPCDSDDQCDWGLYCDLNQESYYYGQCVTSPGGVCDTAEDCAAPGYVCDNRDTCVPGEPPPPPPTCEELVTEAECLDAQECAPVYSGINCTTPGGEACSSETPDCSCESFAFSRCEQFATP